MAHLTKTLGFIKQSRQNAIRKQIWYKTPPKFLSLFRFRVKQSVLLLLNETRTV
jgi:chromosome segregation and condensation protein ScpB